MPFIWGWTYGWNTTRYLDWRTSIHLIDLFEPKILNPSHLVLIQNQAPETTPIFLDLRQQSRNLLLPVLALVWKLVSNLGLHHPRREILRMVIWLQALQPRKYRRLGFCRGQKERNTTKWLILCRRKRKPHEPPKLQLMCLQKNQRNRRVLLKSIWALQRSRIVLYLPHRLDPSHTSAFVASRQTCSQISHSLQRLRSSTRFAVAWLVLSFGIQGCLYCFLKFQHFNGLKY